MKFIKPLCGLSLLVLLSACQFVPTQSTPEPEIIVAEEQQIPSGLTANPYLQNPSPVPAMAEKRYQQALSALAVNDSVQAEFDLQWLTENYPELSGPHLNLALIYQSNQQQEKAKLAFQQAIAANSNNVFAYNQYGIFLRQQGEFKAAEQQYSQALKAWPDFPDGHLNIAILYDLYMGDYDMALFHYQRYQTLLVEPDQQVNGWIIDTERRVKKLQQELVSH